MSDIVERLRDWAGNYEEGSFDTEEMLMREAADEIERLRALSQPEGKAEAVISGRQIDAARNKLIELRNTVVPRSVMAEVLRSALQPSGQTRADGWQTMESAPRDFVTDVDIWARGQRYTDCLWMRPTYGSKEYTWCHYAYDDCNGHVFEVVRDPEFWMPLPDAPSALAAQKKQPTGMWPDWGDRPDGFDGPGGAE
jgi:hypothetical protein